MKTPCGSDQPEAMARGEGAPGLVLVGQGIAYLPYFIAVFQALGETGLGREWGRFRLQGVEAVHPLSGERGTVYCAADGLARDCDLSVGYAETEAAAQELPPDCLRPRFLTPIRIKYNSAPTRCLTMWLPAC